ncbi:MAG: type II toxin-antitoxin system RelE/ParE family toxin [Acidobacteriota bacterium]
MKIEWHPLARYDLAEMLLYIAEDNAEAAYRLQDQIEQQVAMLSRMPEMGRSGRRRGTREMVIAGTSYVAAYRVLSDRLEILRVLHGARRWPKRM